MNNREIKFRIWRPEEEVMIGGVKQKRKGRMDYDVGISYEHDWVAFNDYPNGKHYYFTLEASVEKRCVSDIVVLQYTGLKDKNGKEIYEGDIVCEKETVMSDVEKIMPNYINIRKDDNFKYFDGTIGKRRYGQQTYIVERDESSCGFEPFADSKHNCGHCGGGINGNSIEIVGNIYENPELLSTTKSEDETKKI